MTIRRAAHDEETPGVEAFVGVTFGRGDGRAALRLLAGLVLAVLLDVRKVGS